MQTRCPECHTLFNINPQQLDAADGQVRCGHCFHVFYAEIIDDTSAPVAEDIDTSDIDINTFVDGIEATLDEPEPSTAEDNAAPHFSADFNTNPAIDDLVPPELRHTKPARQHSLLATTFWTLGSIILLAGILVQLVYFNRVELAHNSQYRPYLEQMCELAQCQIPELRDINRLELSSKNVYSHPSVDNALMITAIIVNQAAFAQRFPVLQISFTNLVGDIVMARRFTPAEYLNTGSDNIDEMQPGLPIQITLEVLDPGKSATAYEFSFI